MELIPYDELKVNQSFNFTPMIDFLFLMLSLFATLAITRAKLFDSEVSLVALDQKENAHYRTSDIHLINISISSEGKYKWMTEYKEYFMENLMAVEQELARQYETGAIPHDKNRIEIRLHIDQKAPWKPVAEAIFAVRELGFKVYPVYEPFDSI